MSRIEAEQLAFSHSESGLHCAESVASAIIHLFCPEQTETACRMATGFGGGLAGSRQEACGALTGGVLAIGLSAAGQIQSRAERLPTRSVPPTGSSSWHASAPPSARPFVTVSALTIPEPPAVA